MLKNAHEHIDLSLAIWNHCLFFLTYRDALIEGTYRKALASNPSQGGTLRFTLLQFTRELDPVQSLPLFMEHPDWSKNQRDKDIHNASLDLRINTYNDRAADRVNLTANHRLAHWKSIIASGISEDTLKSLFEDGQDNQDTNQASRISR